MNISQNYRRFEYTLFNKSEITGGRIFLWEKAVWYLNEMIMAHGK